ncbi:hypothetical protein TOK_4435 [Pseudonocardia sp. N23]|nr:hypothetical protein TOK_4435 [Pseudonocardia sp. N23]
MMTAGTPAGCRPSAFRGRTTGRNLTAVRRASDDREVALGTVVDR